MSESQQSNEAARKVTREQLEQAAQLRGEGATWNAIRQATGAKLGSSGWFRAWEREGIEHAPPGQKPKRAVVEPESEKPAATKPAPKTRRRSAAK